MSSVSVEVYTAATTPIILPDAPSSASDQDRLMIHTNKSYNILTIKYGSSEGGWGDQEIESLRITLSDTETDTLAVGLNKATGGIKNSMLWKHDLTLRFLDLPNRSLKSPAPSKRRRTLSSSATNKVRDPPILRTPTRTIYTAGRPPWYNPDGQHIEPCVLGTNFAHAKLSINYVFIQYIFIVMFSLLSLPD